MTQEDSTTSLSCDGGRAELILNRPPLNILTIPMIEEINQRLETVGTDPSVKILLIRGEGRCFSAGMDVSDHLPGKVERMFEVMHEMFDRLATIEIPTISAVHGLAMGGGMELAIFTDLTFASSSARFGQPEIKLGVFPPIAAAHFPALIGAKRAYDLILTGRTLTADEAFQVGLINTVFPEEEFAQRVDEVAQSLTSLSRPVLAATKRAIRQASTQPFTEALKNAEDIYLQEVMSTQDAIEGLTAFLEKRAPLWLDR